MMHVRYTCVALLACALLVAIPAFAEADANDPAGGCLVAASSGSSIAVATYQGDGEPFKVEVSLSCHALEGDTTGYPVRVDRVEITYRMAGDSDAPPPRARRQALRLDCSESSQEHVLTLLTAAQKKRAPFRAMTGPAPVEATLTFYAHQIGAGGRTCTGTLRWAFDVLPGQPPRE